MVTGKCFGLRSRGAPPALVPSLVGGVDEACRAGAVLIGWPQGAGPGVAVSLVTVVACVLLVIEGCGVLPFSYLFSDHVSGHRGLLCQYHPD